MKNKIITLLIGGALGLIGAELVIYLHTGANLHLAEIQYINLQISQELNNENI